ncbi:hypothetical protein GCM10028824_39690 [Hymenobacter segetis]|uniref:TonB family protein n=1 Tax=Hymenobacter segetis TaxID=2025509 RepID=A0ABU9LUC3_9BACT
MLPADSPFARLPAPGPHPAPAELRAYAAGTLAPAEEHRIEAHTLDCERCADILTGFSMSDPATTDQAVAELRARLQTRVEAEEPAPVAGGWAWPRIAVAAAMVGVMATGIWTWQQHEAARPAATARLETPAIAPPAAPAARLAVPEQAEKESTKVSETVVAAAPGASKAADYAAISPARSRHRAPLGQLSRRATKTPDGNAMVMEDKAPASEANAEARVATASNISASAAASTVDSATPQASILAETTSPDTLANNDRAAKASRSFGLKSKAIAVNKLPDNTASVRVADAPMPATPAINPAPVGGTPAFRNYLYREADAFEPEEGQLHLHGTVRLRFMVGADGKISNLKVLRSLRPDYDEEALRMVCEGPGWQPGIAGGRRADLPIELTVTF